MTRSAIELRNVVKSYGAVVAVPGLDLDVAEGSFVSLLGPSGCGKTTTLRLIAGLEQPNSGDIRVKDRRINDVPVNRRNFGMVFQNLALFPHYTAFENIAFGLNYRNVPKEEIKRRVAAALELVRLPHLSSRYPAQLSGGQQQRVAVARAIVIEPDVLLFDEPFSALDAGLREEMRIELKRIQHALGITTVFVTHDQAEALTMSDKVVIMNQGRIEQQGTPEEVFNEPSSEFVMRFFGHVNEYSATVVGQAGDGMLSVDVGIGRPVLIKSGERKQGPTRLLLRAEKVRISPLGSSEPAGGGLHGVVASCDYMGTMVRYAVDVGSRNMTVIQPTTQGITYRKGTRVAVDIPADAWRAASSA